VATSWFSCACGIVIGFGICPLCIHRLCHVTSFVYTFIGTFAYLWKICISFIMSASLSAVHVYQCSFHRTDFREIWYCWRLWKSAERIKILATIRMKVLGTLHKVISTICSCQQHKFAIKALLCSTRHFYIVDRHVAQQYTESALLHLHWTVMWIHHKLHYT